MESPILRVACLLLIFLQIVFTAPMGVQISRDGDRLDDGTSLLSHEDY